MKNSVKVVLERGDQDTLRYSESQLVDYIGVRLDDSFGTDQANNYELVESRTTDDSVIVEFKCSDLVLNSLKSGEVNVCPAGAELWIWLPPNNVGGRWVQLTSHKPDNYHCKCGGQLSIVNIMCSENIPLQSFLVADLSNNDEVMSLNNQLDTPSSFTELQLRCDKCQNPEPKDPIVIDYLDDNQFSITT